MTGRTFSTGGEVLGVGDTVIVFNGRSQRECPITKIGTQRITIDVQGREVPFNGDSRQDCESRSGYVRYFRTKTEVAGQQERDLLVGTLHDLGVQGRNPGTGKDGLRQYPNEVLEAVIAILRGHSG